METRDRAKTRHTSVETTEPLQDRDMKNHASRQDTHLETPSLCIFPSLMLQLSLGYGKKLQKTLYAVF